MLIVKIMLKILQFASKIQCMGFPDDSVLKNPLAKQETWARSLGREDPLKQEMATHSSILAWEIQCTKESGRLHTVHGAAKQSDTTERLNNKN